MQSLRPTPAKRRSAAALLAFSLLAPAATPARADERRPQTRNTTRTNINSGNRTNVNVNAGNRTNVIVNAPGRANVDVDVHVHGGYYYNPRPSAGAVIATAVVVGAIVASLPPNCTTIMVNGLTYQSCGGTYYQPRYSGSTVTYVVVTRP